MESALQQAATVLGITNVKAEQKRAIYAFFDGNDVFVSLPTGFGKSFCFQSLPIINDRLSGNNSIVVIVEPTPAVMRDHVQNLLKRGLKAAFINHEQKDASIRQAVTEGKYQFVYISPESLTGISQYREMLLSCVYMNNLVGLVIDEAHTVMSW